MRGSGRWVMGLLAVALMPVVAEPAQQARARTQDTVVDQVGDWFAALGKPKAQQQLILRRRKAERAKQRAAARQPAAPPAGPIPRAGAIVGIAPDAAVQVQGDAGGGARNTGERLRQDIRQLEKQ